MKECLICNKEFEPKVWNQRCCSEECIKERRRLYDLTPKRKEKNRIWRQSKHGKKYMFKYNHSDKGKLLRKRYAQTDAGRLYKQIYDNQEARKLVRKAYRFTEKGKEVFRMIVRRREAKLHNCVHRFNIEEWMKLKEDTKGVCPNCKSYIGINNLTMDHIYPLDLANKDFKKTGIKRIYNINDVQPLCLSCNVRKSNKIIIPEVYC
jgi:5-methylcytosine-specific restriction endonuclease McrA